MRSIWRTVSPWWRTDTRGPMHRVIRPMDHTQFNTPCNDLGDQIRDWFERVLRGDFGLRNQASALSA